MDDIRSLHALDPQRYTTEALSEQYKISPEAVRRILRSRWAPNERRREEIEEKQEREKMEKIRAFREMREKRKAFREKLAKRNAGLKRQRVREEDGFALQ